MKSTQAQSRSRGAATQDASRSILSVTYPEPIVLGTGLIALDIVVGPGPNNVPRRWAGGTCGNVLTILAFFGWRAFPVATLGNDVAADMIIKDLERFSVQHQYLARSRARHTPIIVERIRIRPDGTPRHRFDWTCPTCGAWLPGYRTVLPDHATALVQKLPDHQAFFFDRVSRSSLSLARASAQHGALVVFEPNGVKAGRLFEEALHVSHIIKYSQERVGPLRMLRRCEGRKLEIETLGDDGLRYRLLEDRERVPRWRELAAYPVAGLKDAAGAGDWCTAGILHSLGRQGAAGFAKMKTGEIENGLNLGQALAALKCRYEGPRGIMYVLEKHRLEDAVQKTLDGGPLPTLAEDQDSPTIREILETLCPSCPQRGRANHKLAERISGR